MNAVREEERLRAVSRYQILDTPREEVFDRVTALLARLLGVPYACVSLIDADRVWYKSAHGLELTEIPRQAGFCHTVAEQGELIHYFDATLDERSKDNEFAQGDNPVRFYVGAPLTTPDGHRIGTLCAFANEARGLSEPERQCVEDLAGLVMHEIESRRARDQLARTEAVLQRSQRLESIGLVASGVAHDFNNLLGGVLGHLELMKDRNDVSDEVRSVLGEVESTARRAADLAGQVLAYAGRDRAADGSAVNLNELVRQTRYMLETATHESTELRFELEDNLPLVSGNPTSLRQLLMNLVVNASESYEGAAGTVRVITRSGPDQRVLLEVIDRGVGMDANTREKAAVPFFTTKVGQRGLGMAVAQNITEQIGAKLSIRSRVGDGATVSVTLGAGGALGPCRAVDPSAEERRQGKGAILVVDDEPAMQNLVRRVLDRAGYEPIIATDGPSALRLFADNRETILAVVLDLSMPAMSGNEVMHALWAEAPGLPVVLVSGHRPEEVRERVGSAPVRAFLKKPFSIGELLEAVNRAIESGADPKAG